MDRRRLIASSRQDAELERFTRVKGFQVGASSVAGGEQGKKAQPIGSHDWRSDCCTKCAVANRGTPLIIVVPLTRRLTNEATARSGDSSVCESVGAVPASPVTPKDNLSLHEKAGIVELITRTTRCAGCDDESSYVWRFASDFGTRGGAEVAYVSVAYTTISW